jgi:outer membrane biosynthesis protein TonB
MFIAILEYGGVSMKSRVKDLSTYVKNNLRFSILLLIVVLVVINIATYIYSDLSNRNIGSESNKGVVDSDSSGIAFNGEGVLKDIIEGNIANGEELNDINPYSDSTDEIFDENGEQQANEADGMDEQIEEKGKLLTYEDIMAAVEKEKLENEDELADVAGRSPDSNEEEPEPEPEPKSEPKPEPKPEPELKPEPPVVELKNIELIIHIHFEDENGKALSAEKVEITVSKIGGGYLSSAFSDGEDARLNVTAVDCVISGGAVHGFVNEGNKEVYLSQNGDDYVKHISYKYKKTL